VTQKERIWWYVRQNLPVREAGSVLGCFVHSLFLLEPWHWTTKLPPPVFLPDAPSSLTMLLRYGTKRGGTRLRSSLYLRLQFRSSPRANGQARLLARILVQD
jgi:hypothetical protein